MRAKTKSFFIVSALMCFTLALPTTSASAATKKTGHSYAVTGCEHVTLSLRINDAFLKLPTAQQTVARKNKTIAAENAAMSAAQKAFAAAAKLNVKWKTFADQINTMLHTDKADEFTKSFTGLVSGCLALAPVANKKAKATATPKATSKK